jgi:hypothetical protein
MGKPGLPALATGEDVVPAFRAEILRASSRDEPGCGLDTRGGARGWIAVNALGSGAVEWFPD